MSSNVTMDYSELQKSVCRQPSLRNLTQVDYGKPNPEQNKVKTERARFGI